MFFFILLYELECITSFFTLTDGITLDDLCSFILNFNKWILVFFLVKYRETFRRCLFPWLQIWTELKNQCAVHFVAVLINTWFRSPPCKGTSLWGISGSENSANDSHSAVGTGISSPSHHSPCYTRQKRGVSCSVKSKATMKCVICFARRLG